MPVCFAGRLSAGGVRRQGRATGAPFGGRFGGVWLRFAVIQLGASALFSTVVRLSFYYCSTIMDGRTMVKRW